jgi:hypothetical protein
MADEKSGQGARSRWLTGHLRFGDDNAVVRCPKSALLLRGGQRRTEHGGSDENTVFGDRRMSGLIAFKQRASAKAKKV